MSHTIPRLRPLLQHKPNPHRHLQPQHTPLLFRRHARVHDVRFTTTGTQASTRIQDKYKDKLYEKARREGHESIGELKEAYREKIQDVRRKSRLPGVDAGVEGGAVKSVVGEGVGSLQQTPPAPATPQTKPQTQSQPQSSSASGTGIKPLSSYLDLPKVSTLPAKEIEYIWRLRHAQSSLSLCATIQLDTYLRMYETAKRHPQFILPLPRPAAEDRSGDIKTSAKGFTGGERTAADVHFLQWGFHPPASGGMGMNNHTSTVIFTHLAAFKLHGTYAQPHTTITHHLDLADSHGIVLLNGSVVDGRGVSVEEGRWLLMCLQKFYDFEGHGGGIGKEKRQGLLEKFSQGDQGFSLEELVDEAERIS